MEGGVGRGGPGGGSEIFLAYCSCCVWIWTWVVKNFFLVYGPPNLWRGSRDLLVPPVSPPPALLTFGGPRKAFPPQVPGPQDPVA